MACHEWMPSWVGAGWNDVHQKMEHCIIRVNHWLINPDHKAGWGGYVRGG